MKVGLTDHPRLYARQKSAIDAAIARVIASGRLDWGEEVPAFEAEFANWNGVSQTVAVHSGTTALKVALLALGIGPGDEVITVANTDISTVSAIHFVGATAVFAEIDPTRRTLDPAAAAAAIGPRTAALLPVDLYGQPADMIALCRLARRHGLAVIEDACLALGAEIDGVKVGGFADVTCFSFAPSKHLGSFGSGGAALTSHADLAERMRKLSAYGQSRTRHYVSSPTELCHETYGLNERLDELQAAILRARLPDLATFVSERRAQAGYYSRSLEMESLMLPSPAASTNHSWRNYVIEAPNRDQLAADFHHEGIATNLTYSPALHLHPALLEMGLSRGALPLTEASTDRLLGLPIGPHLELAEIARVVEVAHRILNPR